MLHILFPIHPLSKSILIVCFFLLKLLYWYYFSSISGLWPSKMSKPSQMCLLSFVLIFEMILFLVDYVLLILSLFCISRQYASTAGNVLSRYQRIFQAKSAFRINRQIKSGRTSGFLHLFMFDSNRKCYLVLHFLIHYVAKVSMRKSNFVSGFHQRNNNCKGGMMEEWHQKLHNNTSPDDVIICQVLTYVICKNRVRYSKIS